MVSDRDRWRGNIRVANPPAWDKGEDKDKEEEKS